MSGSVSYFRGDNNGPPRDSVIPRFHIEPVKDELASHAAGRDIYREEERVQFIMPGNPHQPVERVTDVHRERWKEQYAAFKRGQDMAIEGTPLETWPILSRAQVLEMKAMGLYTVEQCAGMSDLATQKISPGGSRIRELAKAYLDDAEAGALNARLCADKEQLEARVAAQDRQIAELKELVERIHGQQMAAANAPNAIMAHTPGLNDPMEALRQSAPVAQPAASSLGGLDALPVRRRPGRPTNAEIEARRAGEAA